LGGEHHTRQNQNRRGNLSDWTASRWTIIATSDGLVIDAGGGPLQLRQPGRNTSAQQYRQAVRRSANDGIAHQAGAQVFVLGRQIPWINYWSSSRSAYRSGGPVSSGGLR
jgi:hypothetical protein